MNWLESARLGIFFRMKPYETISVRGMPIKRIKSVRLVGSEQTLDYTQSCSPIDRLTQSDPSGELIITVPESTIDPLATVISIELISDI